MIISHQHKFIFIKPQKTAGTSVELLLSRLCGPDDVITPLGFDPDPKVRERHDAKYPQNYYRSKPLKNWELREFYWFIRKGRKPNLNYWEHLHADKIKEYVGETIWDSYLKISIVRNPWDHAVSMFKWMSHYNYEGVSSLSFSQFIKMVYKELWPFYAIKNCYQVDYMIQFEKLEEDLSRLRKWIPLDASKIPVTKSNTRKSSSNSTASLYNQETIELVREINTNVLLHFDYDLTKVIS